MERTIARLRRHPSKRARTSATFHNAAHDDDEDANADTTFAPIDALPPTPGSPGVTEPKLQHPAAVTPQPSSPPPPAQPTQQPTQQQPQAPATLQESSRTASKVTVFSHEHDAEHKVATPSPKLSRNTQVSIRAAEPPASHDLTGTLRRGSSSYFRNRPRTARGILCCNGSV